MDFTTILEYMAQNQEFKDAILEWADANQKAVGEILAIYKRVRTAELDKQAAGFDAQKELILKEKEALANQ